MGKGSYDNEIKPIKTLINFLKISPIWIIFGKIKMYL